MRPAKPSAVASGSTRHSPDVPSTSAGDAGSPTICGRATPSERSRFSSRIARASSAGTTGRRRVDPLGEVPQTLPAPPAGDRDLAVRREELEHLGDVAVVRPAGRRPRHLGGVRDVARRQRTGRRQQVEHPPAERLVGVEPLEPLGCRRPAIAPCRRGTDRGRPSGGPSRRGRLGRRGPGRGARTACGPARAPAAVRRVVRVAEPGPGDEVGARCDAAVGSSCRNVSRSTTASSPSAARRRATGRARRSGGPRAW